MKAGFVKRWVGRALLLLILSLPIAVVLVFVGVQVSSQPRFCGSCHYMEPYYQSWKTSSHNDVTCVECHIPPGIRSEVRKKYEALAMVARYVTGTYSTNPWAEVADQSCLRSGCHEKRLLLGAEVYDGVLFDHQPHLTELRRSKRLRCTSCHSQIVQGSHISVTRSTCFLCHFKDTPPNQGTARCTMCHEIPEKMITTGGLSFDHGEVRRFGMDCLLCHRNVITGEGSVPRERCYTCHNDEERLARFEQTEFLHVAHVTDHKIECLNCHIEIQHRVAALHETVRADCRSCHTEQAGHAAARDLYRGVGGHGVDPSPSKMYLAGITCEACHILPRGATKAATEVSCFTCHGKTYLTIFRSWQLGLAARLEGVSKTLEVVRGKLPQNPSQEVTELLEEARSNTAFVADGRGIHNPSYAAALLEKSFADLAKVLAMSDGAQVIGRPWRQAAYPSACLACHFGVEYLGAVGGDSRFDHETHVVRAPLPCTLCHGEGEEHGQLKIGASSCDGCHERIKGPIREGCLDCHGPAIASVPEGILFPHEKHVESGFDCTVCHEGVEAALHVRYSERRESLFVLGHDFCGTCHAEDVPPEGTGCDKCHSDF